MVGTPEIPKLIRPRVITCNQDGSNAVEQDCIVDRLIRHQYGMELQFHTLERINAAVPTQLAHGQFLKCYSANNFNQIEKPVFYGVITESSRSASGNGVFYVARSLFDILRDEVISDIVQPTGLPNANGQGTVYIPGIVIVSSPIVSVSKFVKASDIIQAIKSCVAWKMGQLWPSEIDLGELDFTLPNALTVFPTYDISTSTYAIKTISEPRSLAQAHRPDQITFGALIDALLYTAGLVIYEDFTPSGDPSVEVRSINGPARMISTGTSISTSWRAQGANAHDIRIESSGQDIDALEISCPIVALVTLSNYNAWPSNTPPTTITQDNYSEFALDATWIGAKAVPLFGLIPDWKLGMKPASAPVQQSLPAKYGFGIDIPLGSQSASFALSGNPDYGDTSWSNPISLLYSSMTSNTPSSDYTRVGRIYRLPAWMNEYGSIGPVTAAGGVKFETQAFEMVPGSAAYVDANGNKIGSGASIRWSMIKDASITTENVNGVETSWIDIKRNAIQAAAGSGYVAPTPIAVTVPLHLTCARYSYVVRFSNRASTDPGFRMVTIKRDDLPMVTTWYAFLRSVCYDGQSGYWDPFRWLTSLGLDYAVQHTASTPPSFGADYIPRIVRRVWRPGINQTPEQYATEKTAMESAMFRTCSDSLLGGNMQCKILDSQTDNYAVTFISNINSSYSNNVAAKHVFGTVNFGTGMMEWFDLSEYGGWSGFFTDYGSLLLSLANRFQSIISAHPRTFTAKLTDLDESYRFGDPVSMTTEHGTTTTGLHVMRTEIDYSKMQTVLSAGSDMAKLDSIATFYSYSGGGTHYGQAEFVL